MQGLWILRSRSCGKDPTSRTGCWSAVNAPSGPLTTVVATCYLLGVSTRRMDKLVETLGITSLSKSQVSVMAKELDAAVEAFRTRPLDAGPYTFVAADALVLKVREAGRVVNVHALIAVGVNAEGYREILGIDVTTAEDGAGWLTFWRSLTARGLSGVKLVTSDAHAGLVAAIGATLPGAAWQRCRTHYTTNLMSVTPRVRGPGCAPCCTRCSTNLTLNPLLLNMIGSSTHCPTSCPMSPITSKRRGRICWRSPRFPSRSGARSGATTPGTTQQGDPPAHRRRGHLPDRAALIRPRRSSAGRTTRRMGRVARYLGLDVLSKSRTVNDTPTEQGRPRGTARLTQLPRRITRRRHTPRP